MSDHNHREEDSGMAKVTVSCEGCNDERVQTTSYSVWKMHLLEEVHQERARKKVKTMSLKEKKRTVVVFGVKGVTPKYILRHFGDISFVANIVFWGKREDFCIITFLYSRFREEVLKTSHIVKKRQVYLRPLDDIPEIEWISICPFAAPEAKDTTVKMEVDNDSGNPSPEDYSEEMSDEGLSDIEAEAEATAASRRSCSSGFEGSREKPEDPGTTIGNDIKPLTLNPVDPSSAPEQSNDAVSVTPVPKSELVTGAEIEIAKSHPQNQVIGTIDIDDNGNNDQEPSTSTLEHQLLIQSAAGGVVENDTTNRNSVTGSNNCQEHLNSVMEVFYTVNLMPVTEWELRQYVSNHLQSMLRDVFPTCLLIQHGIASTGLSVGGEPLNLYVDINGPTGDRNPMNQHDMNICTVISRMQSVVEIAKCFEGHLNIAGLKVHTGDLTFRYTDATHEHGPVVMKCCIRMSGFLAVQSCRLLNFLCKLDNRVRPLLILLRHWANHHNFTMSNPGNDKNFSGSDFFHPTVIQWIVLFFLINKKILPTVESLQTPRDNYTRARLMCQGEDISFCDDPQALGCAKKNDYDKNPETQNPSATCILELAHELFRAFGDEENIRNSIISPNLGEYISKQELENERNSNNSGMKDLKKIVIYLDPKFNNKLVLQHPLKAGTNIAAGTSSNLLQRFQEQCRFTADCLFRLLNLNSEKEMQNPISLLTLAQPISPFSRTGDLHLGMKRQKESFQIHLRIRKKNAVLQQNRMQNWLDLFEDFNNTVWPVCFGVKLYELEITFKGPEANSSFRSAFKGVVANPDFLPSWAFEKHTPKNMFKLITTLYSSLSAEERKKREIEKPSTTPPNKTMEELFSFNCQVVGCGWNLKEENPNATCATIDLILTNVRSQDARYSREGGWKIFRENLKSAYTGLWQRHVQKVSKRKIVSEKPAEGGQLRITSREFVTDSGSD